MSYNITTFKLKEMKDFKISVASLYKHPREDWHPEKEFTEDGKLILKCGCGQTISGTVKCGYMKVEYIELSGEGSGKFWSWILGPALKESFGLLEAVLIWEGGDAINRLYVHDGVVKLMDIDL